VLVLAGVAYAGDRDALVVMAALIVATVGLTQVLPAVLAIVLLRRDRPTAALQASGIAAFVPGVMIAFLTLTGQPSGEGYLVVGFGLLLAALGFHQLLVRSRLA
jgi:hypothetical protein